MRTTRLRNTIAVLAAFGLSLTASAQMEHHHHDAAPPAASEKLGAVSFPTSCAVTSQKPMERGVALLHSFGYTEAQQQFEAIAKADPTCAMAHWGIAMTQFRPLWERPDAQALKLGAEEMAKTRALAGSATPLEHGYIDALSALYKPETTAYEQRTSDYERAMEALHAGFPNDVEVAAFDALAILAAAPPNEGNLEHPRKALAILQPLFAAHPNHPGLAHYIVHTCDTPALAPQGLQAARVYASIAPSSAHALHMPGHIFARLGMWQEDISSNLASMAASEKAEKAHQTGAAHQMHADEFLIYAWLQTGDDEKARALTAKMRSVSAEMAAMPYMDDMKDYGPFFDNELHSIYVLEMRDWKSAAALQIAPKAPPSSQFYVYWANGLAAGHLHDAAALDTAIHNMDGEIEAVKQSPFAWLIDVLNIQRYELVGWKSLLAGKPDDAIASMQSATALQDKLGQQEVDLPAHEIFADMLVTMKQPEQALGEYKQSLKVSPNRLNTLLSAGQVAEQLGRTAEARGFYKTAAAQTANGAHSQRADLKHAVSIANAKGSGL
ncbi:hypothetical protein AB4Y89_20430 [Terriglobus sp. 2YAB30_2]|uniref:hypothetical protein n=1 Tax=Terriglobus sp. 2YAB30_2 TaxID=3233023 RepID=UPI003F969431